MKVEQTGLAEKLADRDEEKKGIKRGLRVRDFSNWRANGNILPSQRRLEEEQILKKKKNPEFHFLCTKLKMLLDIQAELPIKQLNM